MQLTSRCWGSYSFRTHLYKQWLRIQVQEQKRKKRKASRPSCASALTFVVLGYWSLLWAKPFIFYSTQNTSYSCILQLLRWKAPITLLIPWRSHSYSFRLWEGDGSESFCLCRMCVTSARKVGVSLRQTKPSYIKTGWTSKQKYDLLWLTTEGK